MTPAVVPHTVHDGLAVYAAGDGPPVLLVPGPHRFQRPGTPSADALIAGLTALGRRVITYDPPGSGASTRPADVGMAEMHTCNDEALAVLGVTGPVDAVGHSMAGLVLLAYALDRPDRVARLVLVGTGTGGRAYLTAPGALWNRTHPDFAGMAALGSLHTVLPCRATEVLLNRYIARRSYLDRSAAPVGRVRASDWWHRREGRASWHWRARRMDYGPRLGELAVPTLVACGRHDPQYPVSCSEELAAGIADAQLILFERSGHFPFLEEPEAFWECIGTFLGGGQTSSTRNTG